jgi:hypothetical protein
VLFKSSVYNLIGANGLNRPFGMKCPSLVVMAGIVHIGQAESLGDSHCGAE